VQVGLLVGDCVLATKRLLCWELLCCKWCINSCHHESRLLVVCFAGFEVLTTAISLNKWVVLVAREWGDKGEQDFQLKVTCDCRRMRHVQLICKADWAWSVTRDGFCLSPFLLLPTSLLISLSSRESLHPRFSNYFCLPNRTHCAVLTKSNFSLYR
jgi:hypothetical protein